MSGGLGSSARLVRPFEKNLNLTVISPTRTLKIQGFDHKLQDFCSIKIGGIEPAPPALTSSYTQNT